MLEGTLQVTWSDPTPVAVVPFTVSHSLLFVLGDHRQPRHRNLQDQRAHGFLRWPDPLEGFSCNREQDSVSRQNVTPQVFHQWNSVLFPGRPLLPKRRALAYVILSALQSYPVPASELWLFGDTVFCSCRTPADSGVGSSLSGFRIK